MKKLGFITLFVLFVPPIFANSASFKNDVEETIHVFQRLEESLKPKNSQFMKNSTAHQCYNAGISEGYLSNLFQSYKLSKDSFAHPDEVEKIMNLINSFRFSDIASLGWTFCSHSVLETNVDSIAEREELARRMSGVKNGLKRLIELL